MTIRDYLRRQARLHPCLQPQDVIKLCYQAAFGAEHLLSDITAARRYFEEEMASIKASDEPLVEPISPGFCRVNLGAWIKKGLPPDWLFTMFVLTAENGDAGNTANMLQLLGVASKLAQEGAFPFSAAEWRAARAAYEAGGIRALHHSDIYRKQERPAYRVVSQGLTSLIPLLRRLMVLPEKEGAYVIAIDGRAASGKTTAGKALASILGGTNGAGLIHMDEFFLPLSLRTAERLQTPGGNVHHERFLEEVIPHLNKREGFSYRPFSCQTMALGPEKVVSPGLWRIVEGAYSCHPVLGDYMDFRVFFEVSRSTQKARLLQREGESGLAAFLERWLPMEEAYFSAFQTPQKAHLRIVSDANEV
jgi:uridine kinase